MGRDFENGFGGNCFDENFRGGDPADELRCCWPLALAPLGLPLPGLENGRGENGFGENRRGLPASVCGRCPAGGSRFNGDPAPSAAGELGRSTFFRSADCPPLKAAFRSAAQRFSLYPVARSVKPVPECFSGLGNVSGLASGLAAGGVSSSFLNFSTSELVSVR